MKLSEHSKIRMKQRAIVFTNQKKFFKNALEKGKSPNNIKDKKIRNFLERKSKNCKVKLYKNYVFIYSKNSKQLYTVYELPEKLLNKEK